MNASTQNWNFVIAAYLAAWAFLIGYSVYLHRTLRRARDRYERSRATAPGKS
jgi:CcmD family protein